MLFMTYPLTPYKAVDKLDEDAAGSLLDRKSKIAREIRGISSFLL